MVPVFVPTKPEIFTVAYISTDDLEFVIIPELEATKPVMYEFCVEVEKETVKIPPLNVRTSQFVMFPALLPAIMPMEKLSALITMLVLAEISMITFLITVI